MDGLKGYSAKKIRAIPNGTVTRRWIYMDQCRIAAELNAAGTITKRFVYGSKGNKASEDFCLEKLNIITNKFETIYTRIFKDYLLNL